MAFDTKEQEIIKYGLDNGKSKDEVSKAITKYRLSKSTDVEKPVGYSDIISDISQIGTDISKTIETRTGKVQKALTAQKKGEQGALETGFQALGQTAGTISDIFGDVLKGAIKVALPSEAQKSIKGGIESMVTPVVQSDLVKGILSKYNSLPENQKRDIDSALGIGSLALDVTGLGIGSKVAKTGTKVAGEALETAGKTALKAGEGVVDAGGKAITGIKDIVEPITREVSQIPLRVTTNIAESKAITTAIKELPTEVAKTAAKNGIDVNDLTNLYKTTKVATPAEKTALKNLYNVVKTNPSQAVEEVGKPIVSKIKELKVEQTKIGQQLTEEAKNIGKVTTEELKPIILSNLQKTSGLEGLTIKNGKLNFDNTVLASVGSKSDRSAIQSYFNDAIRSGTGNQKHLLRQNIFEYLGGKKGITATTATSDEALQSIRKGLSDILETKSKGYKSLNTQYAKITNPVNEMNKLLRNSGFKDADILNETAGTLARRLTSNAISKGDVRQLLRNLDSAIKGGTQITGQVEKLQDMYNLLDKYYKLSGGTSLKGQIESATGVKSYITKKASQIAGQTEVVTKKSFDDVLDELFK